jgi:hypothetical protein
MATVAPEQLPSGTYVVGGQPTLSGYILPSAQYGFEEDSEVKTKPDGSFNCDIAYSRRVTLSVSLEVLTASASAYKVYAKGGTVASGVFAKLDGTAVGWKIRSATVSQTRGPVVVSLDLIALADEIVTSA